MINQSPYSDWVKEKSIGIFSRVADAEGKVHGMSPEDVHFHEVGALDSIIDILGACLCLEMLGYPRVFAGPVVEGHGWVDCAHGRFPVPTAATLEILAARGVPLEQCDEPHELVTPTGAAILAELAESFSPMKNIQPEKIGYGLGTRDNHTRPNVVRAILGSLQEESGHSPAENRKWNTDRINIIETTIDDSLPEWLGEFVSLAMKNGALDVCLTPVTMKKNRPGTQLQLMAPRELTDSLAELIFRNTTAIGLRIRESERYILRRESGSVETEFGKVEVKSAWLGDEKIHTSPEFESAKKISEDRGVPLREIYRAVASTLRD